MVCHGSLDARVGDDQRGAGGLFEATANLGAKITKVANLIFSDCTISMPANGQGEGRSFAFCVGKNNGAVVSGIRTTNCTISVANNINAAPNTPVYLSAVVAWNRGDGAGNYGLVTDCQTTGGYVGLVSYPGYVAGNQGNGINIGGVVGRSDISCSVEYCINNSTEIHGFVSGGGVIGLNNGIVRYSGNKATVWSGVRVGGVVGCATQNGSAAEVNFRMEYCYNTGPVHLEAYNNNPFIGGLVGAVICANPQVIRYCFNSGSVTVNTTGDANNNRPVAIGGLVGTLANNASMPLVENCYNTGTITLLHPTAIVGSTAIIGGLIGTYNALNSETSTTKVAYCYSSGPVTITANNSITNKGILVGNRVQPVLSAPMAGVVYIKNNLTQNGTAFNDPVGGAQTDKTNGTVEFESADMTNRTKFETAGYDFTDVWQMGGTKGYPILKGMPAGVPQ